MSEIVFALPIVHGKDEIYRQTWAEVEGARRDEYAAALKDAGMTRQAIWHQKMPGGGSLAIVYIEAADPEAPRRFTSSDADINRWYVQRMKEVYGRDFTHPALPVELHHDFRV